MNLKEQLLKEAIEHFGKIEIRHIPNGFAAFCEKHKDYFTNEMLVIEFKCLENIADDIIKAYINNLKEELTVIIDERNYYKYNSKMENTNE